VLVAARVIEFKPASLKPFADVSAEITAKLVREEAAKLAAKQGQAQLEELKRAVRHRVDLDSGHRGEPTKA
jgi:peptidyl-prolyl cis-trans isomerase D